MKHGHLTEQRKHFVEAYCRLGNGTLAAKEAGYKDSPSLVNPVEYCDLVMCEVLDKFLYTQRRTDSENQTAGGLP